jgi:hypothetical protein
MLFIQSNIESNLRFLSPLQKHSLQQHPMPREAEIRVAMWLSLTVTTRHDLDAPVVGLPTKKARKQYVWRTPPDNL